MKTLNKLLRSGNASNNVPVISSGKVIKTMIAILMFACIMFLLPSCMVGLRTSGNDRRTGSTTERHDGNGRDRHGKDRNHDNDGHHNNDEHHDNDEHHNQ